ncbi:MAG: SpoIIE family protein phosphatase [Anaerolineae bacterium]
MEIQVAAAKIKKYATSQSGDTLEMIERPHGGLSFVLADGQRSGRGAKAISNIVARKAVSLLADGVRDGAVARAAHDYLFTLRGGQVQSTLDIVSIDLVSQTLVLSRNSHCPTVILENEELRLLDEPCQPIGIYRKTKPIITELPLKPGLAAVVFTDGVLAAGRRKGQKLDILAEIDALTAADFSAQFLADTLLDRALDLDEGRPVDDTSILVVAVFPRQRAQDIRRLTVTFPI